MDHPKIDTHCHVIPDFYRDILVETGHSNVDGMPGIPDWSTDDHLKFMNDVSISKSILSISSPGVSPDPLNDALTVDLARRCNDFAGNLKKTYPDKFGFWASLPMPNIRASLDEIEYAFDKLDADGIGLLTNYHGHYLGSKLFSPVFAALNHRKATVFIHPSTPCIAAPKTDPPTPPTDATPFGDDYPAPVFEFFFDSTRAVLNLFLTGTISRYPDIRYIVSHAGAVLPPLLERSTRFNEILGLDPAMSSQFIKDKFAQQFFFDMAGYPFPDQIHGLLRCVKPSKLLYGSDYPFTPEVVVTQLVDDMDEGMRSLWGDEEGEEKRTGVWEGNAKKLLEGHVLARL